MISKYHIKEYCRDDISLIENYNKAITDTEQMWECHHRLELTLDGEYAHSKADLKRLGMYYNRPYFELIFLTKSEHNSIHSNTEEVRRNRSEAQKGKKLSIETKRKISAAKKGNKCAKGHHHSEEYRIKKSETMKKWWKDRKKNQI